MWHHRCLSIVDVWIEALCYDTSVFWGRGVVCDGFVFYGHSGGVSQGIFVQINSHGVEF